ncbi:MAG: hypoxanthine phosphoribosyltransferase [Arsenophonus sp.]|nr:MAG: hypoxanthine phosphoribosyltransferase [Arsenophonus sp.]
MKPIIKIMITELNIKNRINEMASSIVEYYRDNTNELLLVGLLKGSFIFMADLCRKINIPHEVDFMIVSSYENRTYSTRDVKIIKDLDENICGKNVLLVEDIIDSGNTLKKVRDILELRLPKSITICTLLDKPSRREVDVPINWIGYSIKNEFVVGYGIDYSQQYRHLPYIAHLVKLKK